VLLIGCPDPDNPHDASDVVGDVPMKMCWPRVTDYSDFESATDHFFADLTGDWDLDGDGNYGEYVRIDNPRSPDPSVDPETFSVRWTGRVEATADGTYWFATSSTDGIRVIVDNDTIIDNWISHEITRDVGSIDLTVGLYDIQIEFYEGTNDAAVRLFWLPPGALRIDRVPSSMLYYFDGTDYVSGGLNAEYFNNIDFTSSALTRVDPYISFFWGTGDLGTGGVDFAPELYVGRIPVYDADYGQLNEILQKIIDYETGFSIPEWRRKFLFAAVYVSGTSSDYLLSESLKVNVADPLLFSTYRVYESDFGIVPPPECDAINPSDPDPAAECNMLKELVHGGGYGVLGWSTHGQAPFASSLMNSSDCYYLDDSRPCFTFQGSCHNACPEDNSNLGYALLKQGAIATIAATRISFNSCFVYPNRTSGINCQLNYHYFKRLMNGITAGRALFRTKEDVSSRSSWIWMNKMGFNIYGDPSISLFRPYEFRDLDLVQVLDHSGSMAGYTSASMTDRKIDVLKFAAHHFVDLMDADAGHQFGICKFSTTASTPFSLQPFTAFAKSLSHTSIDGVFATDMTSIGDGLQHAVDEFTSHGDPDHRKTILLVTDGKENTTPMITDVLPSIIGAGITVYPLGLGYSWGVDETRLVDLANNTGGDYRITDDDLMFRKYFIEILGAATDWTVAVDPILELTGGACDAVAVAVAVAIASSDTMAIFTAYWSDYDNAIALDVVTPGGNAYSLNSQTYVSEARYCFHQIDLKSIPAIQRIGTWKMIVKADTNAVPPTEIVRVSASAFVKSGSVLDAGFDNPFVVTGDGVLVRAQLTDYRTSIINAYIRAQYTKPTVGFGNVVYNNPVDVSLLKPQIINGDTLDRVYWKAAYLQEKLGNQFMPRDTGTFMLYDDGMHQDGAANDGVYANRFTKTRVPGNYVFHFYAEYERDGKKCTREWTASFNNRVNINTETSSMSVKYLSGTADGKKYRLMIIPADKYGNYLGPGHEVTAVVKHDKGTRKIKLFDNLDCSYSRDIIVTKSELDKNARIDIEINDNTFVSSVGLQRMSPWSISLHAGAAIPIGNLDDTYDVGYNALLDIDYHITPMVSLCGFFGYNNFASGVPGIDSNYVLNFSLNMRYNQLLWGISGQLLSFFLGAGPGVYLSKNEINLTSGETVEEGELMIGANFGVGLNFSCISRVTFELGADYHQVFDPDFGFVHSHVGIIYRF
jgi:hypothetical protein